MFDKATRLIIRCLPTSKLLQWKDDVELDLRDERLNDHDEEIIADCEEDIRLINAELRRRQQKRQNSANAL